MIEILFVLLILLMMFICDRIFIVEQQRIISRFIAFQWIAIILLSWINPYSLYEPSTLASIYVYSMPFFYLIGYMCANFSTRKAALIALTKSNGMSFKIVTNSTIFKAAVYLCTSILGYYFYKYYVYMQENPIGDSRRARFYTGMVFSNGYEVLFFNTILSAFMLFISYLICFALVNKWKLNRIYLLLILCEVFWIGFGAGRSNLIEILLIFIYTSIIGSHKIKFSKHVLVILVLTLSAFLLTYYRSVSDASTSYETIVYVLNEFFSHFTTYFTGPVVAFSHALNNMTEYGYPGFGLFTFNAIDEMLKYILMAVNLDVKPHIYQVNEILSDNIYISDDIGFNALYSAAYNFFFDLNYFGIIIFPFLIGFFTSRSVMFSILCKREFAGFLGALLFIVSVWLPLTFKLSGIDYFIAAVAALFFMHKKVAT